MVTERKVFTIDVGDLPIEKAKEYLQELPIKTHNADAQLKAVVERIERLEEEKSAIVSDIKDIYSEAKGNGFDVKALRTIIRLRKMDQNERQEQDTILELYMKAMGMF